MQIESPKLSDFANLIMHCTERQLKISMYFEFIE